MADAKSWNAEACGQDDVTLAPHCPLGMIALAACLHIDFVSYNAVLQEQVREFIIKARSYSTL